MKQVEDYERVRRMYFREGVSKREIIRRTGFHWTTVEKMLAYSIPPGYRRRKPPKRSKLGPFIGIIDSILDEDRSQPRKQRHTAKRLFERLNHEYGFEGGYTIVKDYVREKKRRDKEVFIPLYHPPAEAQVDFGKAQARIGGVLTEIKLFCLDLCHSDAIFVKAFPTEKAEAFLQGHVDAFSFFEGVPKRITYDNTKVAVNKVLKGRERSLTETFVALKSHYLFEHRFCRVFKPNEKGKVENLVGYARRNFLVPVPDVPDFAALNEGLLKRCRERMEDRLRGHGKTIGERFEEEKGQFLPLPPAPIEPCRKESGRVNGLLLVRFDRNDYSAPSKYAYQEVEVKGFVDRVELCHKDEVIAIHKRSYGRGQSVFDPVHYLAVLERKPGALEQAKPLAGWKLPMCFEDLRRLLEAGSESRGRREYIQVLRLLEHAPLAEVRRAVETALSLGVYSFDAVKLTLLRMLEGPCRVSRLDRGSLESIPFPRVKAADLSLYGLLAAAGEACHG